MEGVLTIIVAAAIAALVLVGVLLGLYDASMKRRKVQTSKKQDHSAVYTAGVAGVWLLLLLVNSSRRSKHGKVDSQRS